MGLLGGALTSCSAASPAAIVNGQTITQAQLNDYLEAWAGSPAYVQSYDQSAEAQYSEQVQEAQSEGESAQDVAPPAFVEGNGTGPAVYDMQWTTTEIRLLITQLAVHQYLDKHREAPTPVELAASWASQYAVDPAVWLQITAQARAGAAEWDADHALIDTKLTNAKEDKQFYKGEQSYFWSKVCVATVDISVDSNGQVDMAASKKQAEAVANELSGVKGGPRYLSRAGPATAYHLSRQSNSRRSSAISSARCALAKQRRYRENFGYEVVQVISRDAIPYNNRVAAIIDIVAISGQSQSSDPKVNTILSAAKIEFNPAYPGL